MVHYSPLDTFALLDTHSKSSQLTTVVRNFEDLSLAVSPFTLPGWILHIIPPHEVWYHLNPCNVCVINSNKRAWRGMASSAPPDLGKSYCLSRWAMRRQSWVVGIHIAPLNTTQDGVAGVGRWDRKKILATASFPPTSFSWMNVVELDKKWCNQTKWTKLINPTLSAARWKTGYDWVPALDDGVIDGLQRNVLGLHEVAILKEHEFRFQH